MTFPHENLFQQQKFKVLRDLREQRKFSLIKRRTESSWILHNSRSLPLDSGRFSLLQSEKLRLTLMNLHETSNLEAKEIELFRMELTFNVFYYQKYNMTKNYSFIIE